MGRQGRCSGFFDRVLGEVDRRQRPIRGAWDDEGETVRTGRAGRRRTVRLVPYGRPAAGVCVRLLPTAGLRAHPGQVSLPGDVREAVHERLRGRMGVSYEVEVYDGGGKAVI